MDTELKDLKLVVLDSAYDNWSDPFTLEMFSKLVQLKLTGYQNDYPYGVLPIDATDFVGTHFMVCKSQAGSLSPVGAYRVVSIGKCRQHCLGFPLQSLLKIIGSSRHLAAVERIIKNCDEKKMELAYSSSWTLAPETRNDPDFRDTINRVIFASHVGHRYVHGFDRGLAAGVIRFKTERAFAFLGYEPLKDSEDVLSGVNFPFLFDEPVNLFYLKDFSEMAKRNFSTLESVWANRIEISAKPDRYKKVA